MIYIVRHGETSWNLEKRTMGRIDIELNEQGILQAQQAANKLKDIKFDVVFSSPLKRAFQTAQIITKLPIIKDERIIERCNGELDGKLKSEIPADFTFNDENETRFGIENLHDFNKRVADFWRDVRTNYPGKNVLVVTHNGVIIATKVFFEPNHTGANLTHLKVDNCAVLTYPN